MDDELESSTPHISLPEFLFVEIGLIIVDLVNWIPVLGSVVGAVVGPSLTIYTFLRGLPPTSPIITLIASIGEEVPALQAFPLYSISFAIVYVMTNHPTLFGIAVTGGAAAPLALAEKLGVPGADKAMGAIRSGAKQAVSMMGGARGASGAVQAAGSEAGAAAKAVEQRPSRQSPFSGPAKEGVGGQESGDIARPQRAGAEYAKEFMEQHNAAEQESKKSFEPFSPESDGDEDVTVHRDGTVDLSGYRTTDGRGAT